VSADRSRAAPEPADTRTEPAAANPERSDADRLADHAEIDRLADDLVPALIAKLSATGLGEIEVGEGSWTVRVRRPADASGSHSRRSTDRSSRSQPGHGGHGHAPGAFEGHRPLAGAASGSSNGSSPGVAATGGTRADGDGHGSVATSPAVGIFQPRPELRSGTRVRAGDRLGAVDMLGVAQEVVAPADGIVGATLVAPGEAVEYGQELIVIELAARSADAARTAERTEA
jgi:biotin carboxyl carrier protein